MIFHRHDFNYFSSKRLEMHGKTFMVSIYLCRCGKVDAQAADMEPYLNMKESGGVSRSSFLKVEN